MKLLVPIKIPLKHTNMYIHISCSNGTKQTKDRLERIQNKKRIRPASNSLNTPEKRVLTYPKLARHPRKPNEFKNIF